jgi:hypothetical protein
VIEKGRRGGGLCVWEKEREDANLVTHVAFSNGSRSKGEGKRGKKQGSTNHLIFSSKREHSNIHDWVFTLSNCIMARRGEDTDAIGEEVSILLTVLYIVLDCIRFVNDRYLPNTTTTIDVVRSGCGLPPFSQYIRDTNILKTLKSAKRRSRGESGEI